MLEDVEFLGFNYLGVCGESTGFQTHKDPDAIVANCPKSTLQDFERLFDQSWQIRV